MSPPPSARARERSETRPAPGGGVPRGSVARGEATPYALNPETEVAYLFANGVRLARLAYEATGDVPSIGGETLHVFFELGDHLGSTSVVLDKATGELVERSTYQAYGGSESDYRPERWKHFREDYRFTGKEEDVEVGLIYFGKRFLNPLLNRWVSADPLVVHAISELLFDPALDQNLYAYVAAQVQSEADKAGLYPTRNLVTTARAWRIAFEKTVTLTRKNKDTGKTESYQYSRGGNTKGAEAARTLKLYGETTGYATSKEPTGKARWMNEQTRKYPKAESKRYIYTKKGGWIDMAHFMFYAGRARYHLENADRVRELWKQRMNDKSFIKGEPTPRVDPLVKALVEGKISNQEYAVQMSMREARLQEEIDKDHSKYTYEDLPSDRAGAEFGARVFDPDSKKTLGQQVYRHLRSLKARKGESAPNWKDVPSGSVMTLDDSPIPRNTSEKPMYTKD